MYKAREALEVGIFAFNPGPHMSLAYKKAVHSRTCQALDGHDCDCCVGQWLAQARAALEADDCIPREVAEQARDYMRHTSACHFGVGWPTMDRACNCGLHEALAELDKALKEEK